MTMDREYFKQNMAPSQTFHGTVAHTMSIIEQHIGATYGPFGAPNLFKANLDVTASKDGLENVTMMKFESSIAAAVHQMVFEVANHQARVVGDGTTTAMLLTAAVYKALRQDYKLHERFTPSHIASAAKMVQSGLIDALENMAMPMQDNDVYDLAFTSTDANDELAKLLTNLYNQVPDLADKNILLDYATGDKSYVHTVQGMNISGKLAHPGFANREPEVATLHNAEVLIVDGKAVIENDIINYTKKLLLQERSLLIICSGVNENFIRFIEHMSKQQPELLSNFCVVYSKANTIQDSDVYHDAMKVTGCAHLEEGTVISAQTIEEIYKGSAENVLIKNRKITLGGFKESEGLNRYIDSLRAKIDEYESDLSSGLIPAEEETQLRNLKNRLNARVQTMTGGVTTVYVGGESLQRRGINYRLVEDGLKALQSALKDGYFVGCNTAPLNAIAFLISQQIRAGLANDLITILLEAFLNAYINVYHRLITNRAYMDKLTFLAHIAPDLKYIGYDEETGLVSIVEPVARPIFVPFNLRSEDEQSVIINPAQTDINVVHRAIDTAVVLATSNTIFVEKTEFEAWV